MKFGAIQSSYRHFLTLIDGDEELKKTIDNLKDVVDIEERIQKMKKYYGKSNVNILNGVSRDL